jgi:hypothetical protein
LRCDSLAHLNDCTDVRAWSDPSLDGLFTARNVLTKRFQKPAFAVEAWSGFDNSVAYDFTPEAALMELLAFGKSRHKH